MRWNTIVTVAPGRGHEHELLGALAHLGRFHATAYRYVCAGEVADAGAFLEAIAAARAAQKRWTSLVGRVIPVERVFSFAPETLALQLREAIAPLVARMTDGSFCVRVERRGLAGRISSHALERDAAEHAYALAAAAGKNLRTDFEDPDFVVAGETLGDECGITLLTRDLMHRYPFIHAR